MRLWHQIMQLVIWEHCFQLPVAESKFLKAVHIKKRFFFGDFLYLTEREIGHKYQSDSQRERGSRFPTKQGAQ